MSVKDIKGSVDLQSLKNHRATSQNDRTQILEVTQLSSEYICASQTIFHIYLTQNISLLSLAFERQMLLIQKPTRLVYEVSFRTWARGSTGHPSAIPSAFIMAGTQHKRELCGSRSTCQAKIPLGTYMTSYQKHHVSSMTVRVYFSLFGDL